MKTKDDTRYENSLFINKYIALWAYGYINGFGDAEGLYSCIARMCTLLDKKPKRILDIGCGIGRTSFDLAQIFPYAEILGIDKSELMIAQAKLLNSSYYKDKLIDIGDLSMFSLKAPTFNYKNVTFVATSFEKYAKKCEKEKIDLITNVNYLDRCDDIKESLELMNKTLNSGGHVVGSTPLNFRNYNKIISKDELQALFKDTGFESELFYDDVVYREILDARKAVEEYKVICFKLIKI